MKQIDTEILTKQLADMIQIDDIIQFLFEEEHIWLCLYDSNETKNPNYIQVHSDTNIADNDVFDFLKNHGNTTWLQRAERGENIYLIETRKYDREGNFKHYRAFIPDMEIIQSYFMKYFHNEDFSVEDWLDVSDEFVSKI